MIELGNNKIVPEIDYKKWYGSRADAEGDNDDSSFISGVSRLKNWGKEKDKDAKGDRKKIDKGDALKKVIDMQDPSMDKYMQEIIKICDKISKLEGWKANLPLAKINERRVGDDQKGFEGSDLYKSVFLLIQAWGGRMGKSPTSRKTNQYSGQDRGASRKYMTRGGKDIGRDVDTSANLSSSWLPDYKEAVLLIKDGKFQDALIKLNNIPGIETPFSTKHLAIWGNYFHSRGLLDKIPTIYDTRIARMLIGTNANAEDYNSIEDVYDYIVDNIDSAKGLNPYQIEKALFGFSKHYFDNPLKNIKGGLDPNNEEDAEALSIFTLRNPDAGDAEENNNRPQRQQRNNNQQNNRGLGITSAQIRTARNAQRTGDTPENHNVLRVVVNAVSGKTDEEINDTDFTDDEKRRLIGIRDQYTELNETWNKWAKWATK
jgi:hypothetical protein